MTSPSGRNIDAGRIPGERIETTVVTANSGNITTTETTVASITAALVSGRRYAITFKGAGDAATAGDTIDARIREDSSSGTEMQLRRIDLKDNTGRWPIELYAEYEAVATGDKTFVATFERASGTGNVILNASATIPTYLYVDYISG